LHCKCAMPDPSSPGAISPVSDSGGSWSALAPIGCVRGSVMSTSYPQRMQIGSHFSSTILRQALPAAELRGSPLLVVVIVSPLRVCVVWLLGGSPWPWLPGHGVGVRLVTACSMGMGLWWFLLGCLSSLCNSSHGCMCSRLLRSVLRTCPLWFLPSLCRSSRARAVARSDLPLWFVLVHY